MQEAQMNKKNLYKSILITLALSSTLLIGCTSKGYIEVRNQSSDVIMENVVWDDTVNLGNIHPGDEKGKETELFGTGVVSFIIDGIQYYSDESLTVDAGTSATYKFQGLNP